jgi:hypothetical protein
VRRSPAIRCLVSPLPSSRSSALGLDDFEVETAEEGLGPAFTGTSCAACHWVPAVGGMSAIAEVRAGRLTADGRYEASTPAARRWSTCSRCPATAASR